ncbi:M14 family metallocarboxypeptidase [Bacillota bacterium Lsc_1132]
MTVQHNCVEMGFPCDSNWLDETIYKLEKVYPFITVCTIGKSVLGKPIREIRIGNGPKKIHMNGSFHANEWITTVVLMKLLDRYLFSVMKDDSVMGCRAVDLYKRTALSLVPMVNPDGVDLVLNGPPDGECAAIMAINEGNDEFVHWKANIRGVDLNKQYPANWEIDQRRKAPKAPAPRDYPGTAPLTEPESIAMAELAKRNDFDYLLAFHTQGEEFYWGYEGMEPAESAMLANEFERTSGYKAIQYVDSHAGYKDWFIQEFRRPGFTIELGKGINPLPLSHLDKIIADVEGLFFAALSFELLK